MGRVKYLIADEINARKVGFSRIMQKREIMLRSETLAKQQCVVSAWEDDDDATRTPRP